MSENARQAHVVSAKEYAAGIAEHGTSTAWAAFEFNAQLCGATYDDAGQVHLILAPLPRQKEDAG
jgi:hypothetical protein